MLELTKRLLAAADGSGAPVVMASVLEPGARDLDQGSRLLVESDGERAGSLGDGGLDDLVALHAPRLFHDHAALTMYVVDAASAPQAEEGEELLAINGLTLTPRTVAGATAIYMEVVEHKPVFLVVGAGHIGRCLVKLADMLDFHVAVLDDREEFADPERVPEADEVICDDFEAALDRYPIGPNTSVVMVTRGHRQDEVSLRKVLGRGAGYVGMIGSRRRTGAVLRHLRDEGFDAEDLARVRTPIGLDIGAETPEEIAVAVMAEVILLRRGGSGQPMYYRPAELR
jgi:xanthine dehydrogenase accessory factor